MIMPAIVVKIIAATRISRKFMWMPGSSAALPDTRMWMPSWWLMFEKNSDPNQPIVYAPIAKNATYPRSSSPANPTMMFRPSAITV
jgi:hypothetical protein